MNFVVAVQALTDAGVEFWATIRKLDGLLKKDPARLRRRL